MPLLKMDQSSWLFLLFTSKKRKTDSMKFLPPLHFRLWPLRFIIMWLGEDWVSANDRAKNNASLIKSKEERMTNTLLSFQTKLQVYFESDRFTGLALRFSWACLQLLLHGSVIFNHAVGFPIIFDDDWDSVLVISKINEVSFQECTVMMRKGICQSEIERRSGWLVCWLDGWTFSGWKQMETNCLLIIFPVALDWLAIILLLLWLN